MYFLAAGIAAVVFLVMGLLFADKEVFLTGINGAIVALVGLGVLRAIEDEEEEGA